MASVSEHLNKAERNEVLYRDLCRLESTEPEYTEWELVALFYSLVHHVEAYRVVRERQNSDNHSDRNRFIWESADLREIWPAYSYIYRLSMTARYEVVSFYAEEVRQIEMNQYAAIKGHVRALLRV